jgi:hypothetical protein
LCYNLNKIKCKYTSMNEFIHVLTNSANNKKKTRTAILAKTHNRGKRSKIKVRFAKSNPLCLVDEVDYFFVTAMI